MPHLRIPHASMNIKDPMCWNKDQTLSIKEKEKKNRREGGKERKVGERGREERRNFALGSNRGVRIASLTQWT